MSDPARQFLRKSEREKKRENQTGAGGSVVVGGAVREELPIFLCGITGASLRSQPSFLGHDVLWFALFASSLHSLEP